ncbi:hypothetical protein B7R87_26550 [Streptomyces tsukubensis]|uniref:Uncharacterized protein n=1 Tax=Streptomyces tsukubensis (strain DSM 42081 / NBRC 108919 / NRRL 18488 / 9993) TaxID=1114943 RepID=A0A7G3U9A4_STRT9|nr:hypothetical protein B7R87_26550 [Streptomyces tsukubensis]QKM66993.1 hypothetical protein STSU_007230 [Streptomyces tsukubensis NRRL18488]
MVAVSYAGVPGWAFGGRLSSSFSQEAWTASRPWVAEVRMPSWETQPGRAPCACGRRFSAEAMRRVASRETGSYAAQAAADRCCSACWWAWSSYGQPLGSVWVSS